MVGEKTADKAVGRTRGGLNTKIHAVVDGLGNPVEFLLSAGNDHDSVHAMELLEKVQICGSNVLADRAYGARTIREYISEHGASYVIPVSYTHLDVYKRQALADELKEMTQADECDQDKNSEEK